MDPLTVGLVVAAVAVGVVVSRVFSGPKKQQERVSNEPVEVSPEPKSFQPSAAPLVEADREAIAVEARSRAKEIIIEAKDQALKIRAQAEDDVRRIKEGSVEIEKRIAVQKAEVDAKERDIEQKVKTLRTAKEQIEKKQLDIEELYKKTKDELEKVASMTKDEARSVLLKELDKDLAQEKGKRIRQVEEEIKHDSDKLSQEILVSAMRFAATDIVVEYTTSKVKLPDDDVKGRIIGKEGRNIRTFEELTGVDLDLDSSPGEIIVSCFDPVRREIAKISLEKLLADGRIQPAKIEEIVEKTRSEIDHLIVKAGDDLCHKVGAYNIPRDLVQILGRFKYRFSYGQNMIEHTLEETKIGIALAHELNANVDIVRLGCLFHDIGKVVTEDEGTHIQLGVDLLRKHKIQEEVINCVAEHHEDKPFSSVESAIVNLADHVSGTRPGARSEDYESYVTRLKELEKAATSFDGVEKAYAVSAGREVRVIVSPERVDDLSTAYLAKEIAKKIELEQTYPGVVKVIVIRETRAIETAK